ncbi:MAG: trypsin-like peptidase domain-containing protein [Candidatus Ryanbacteria bacterium]|nr:trypsin-like peptidase domain-containing protein [Candidatus Ryanbacteria bacterium]
MYRTILFFIFALAISFLALTTETRDVVTFENAPPAALEVELPKEVQLPEPEPTPVKNNIALAPPPAQGGQATIPAPSPIPDHILFEKGIKATVHLVCPAGNGLYTLATGAIIDRRGYIITNAHVADDLSRRAVCTVERGSPSREIGQARLIMLPESYKAATTSTERAHYDVSLWKMERMETPLEEAWEFDFGNFPKSGDRYLTQSYPGEFEAESRFFTGATLLFSAATVTDTDIYLIGASGALASQKGSSGGILIDRFTGRLRGLIFGIDVGNSPQIEKRTLYSLTPYAINTAIEKETGKTLLEYLVNNP